MQLHYKTYGNGAPVLILHGLFGSLANWHSISLKLAERFRIFAVDQRNHGHSPHSDQMSYGTMADDLSELLHLEHLPRAHVMGHSMGGKTAMQFALICPELVEKLIVVDIAPRAYAPRHEKILSAMLSLEPSAFPSRKGMEEALADAIPDLPLRQFLLKNVERDADGRFQWRIGLREIQQSYPELGRALRADTPFRKTALFLRGEHSDFLVEGDLPAIRSPFPRARLETIPGAGHLVHIENQQAFLHAVLAFLDEDND